MRAQREKLPEMATIRPEVVSSDPGPGARQGQISGQVETVDLKINGDYWWVFRFEWGPRPPDRREVGLDLVEWRRGGGSWMRRLPCWRDVGQKPVRGASRVANPGV